MLGKQRVFHRAKERRVAAEKEERKKQHGQAVEKEAGQRDSHDGDLRHLFASDI